MNGKKEECLNHPFRLHQAESIETDVYKWEARTDSSNQTHDLTSPLTVRLSEMLINPQSAMIDDISPEPTSPNFSVFSA